MNQGKKKSPELVAAILGLVLAIVWAVRVLALTTVAFVFLSMCTGSSCAEASLQTWGFAALLYAPAVVSFLLAVYCLMSKLPRPLPRRCAGYASLAIMLVSHWLGPPFFLAAVSLF